ncbi:MAG TPA: hypothetical protein PKW82_07385, partial [Spirochaetales bacterium]|nr:hypothetical protein [Spirochaetales bacterium]
ELSVEDDGAGITDEALAFARAGALFVDLRENYETNFRVFDIDEVLYLPWSRFDGRCGALPGGRALILADAAGIYPRLAARILAAKGYANLAKLSGGMIDWCADGFPVRMDALYELGGQCACKIRTRAGANPLVDKRAAVPGQSADSNDKEYSMTRVLFLCVHNSARSQMAEAFLKRIGGGRFEVESAGLEPGKLNPFVVRAMAEKGIDISGNGTKSVFDLHAAGRKFDVVVTVCSKDAAERCPIFPGRVERHHWPFDDPSSMKGSDGEIMAGLRRVRDGIEAAVREFAAGR